MGVKLILRTVVQLAGVACVRRHVRVFNFELELGQIGRIGDNFESFWD